MRCFPRRERTLFFPVFYILYILYFFYFIVFIFKICPVGNELYFSLYFIYYIFYIIFYFTFLYFLYYKLFSIFSQPSKGRSRSLPLFRCGRSAHALPPPYNFSSIKIIHRCGKISFLARCPSPSVDFELPGVEVLYSQHGQELKPL